MVNDNKVSMTRNESESTKRARDAMRLEPQYVFVFKFINYLFTDISPVVQHIEDMVPVLLSIVLFKVSHVWFFSAYI
jgi:hypothetical protein